MSDNVISLAGRRAPQPGPVPFVLVMQAKMEELVKIASEDSFRKGVRFGLREAMIAWVLFSALCFLCGMMIGMVV